MNKRFYTVLIAFTVMLVWLFSCSKIENETNISIHGDDESHYTGDNCMNCHYQEGPGEGWFTVAGSVFGNYQNYSVRIIDPNTADLLATIPIDGLGNLFTTESIDFSNGINIDIIDATGQIVAAMGPSVHTGQCNLCHNGDFEPKIEL